MLPQVRWFFATTRWHPDRLGLTVLRLIVGHLVPIGAPLTVAACIWIKVPRNRAMTDVWMSPVGRFRGRTTTAPLADCVAVLVSVA
jgi:hypothetical protein